MLKVNLVKAWYNKSTWLVLLLPIAFLYRTITTLRHACYRYGLLKQIKIALPIIVVGNITVGGTGKTPFVIWLAKQLQQQGLRPGIISRGYGANVSQFPYAVTSEDSAEVVGDEPLLIARKTGCPLYIDPNRSQAAQALMANTDCNVVISDDGLQHYRLKRDLEIAIVDGQRRFGNGFSLPAGPLREPVSRLNKVDVIVNNGESHPGEFKMDLVPQRWHKIINQEDTALSGAFQGQTIHAVAGIGNPRRFFTMLRNNGLTIIEHAFPDHHPFKKADFNFGDDLPVVLTEKDAVKCEIFADERFWVAPVEADVDNRIIRALFDSNRLRAGNAHFSVSNSL